MYENIQYAAPPQTCKMAVFKKNKKPLGQLLHQPFYFKNRKGSQISYIALQGSSPVFGLQYRDGTWKKQLAPWNNNSCFLSDTITFLLRTWLE